MYFATRRTNGRFRASEGREVTFPPPVASQRPRLRLRRKTNAHPFQRRFWYCRSLATRACGRSSARPSRVRRCTWLGIYYPAPPPERGSTCRSERPTVSVSPPAKRQSHSRGQNVSHPRSWRCIPRRPKQGLGTRPVENGTCRNRCNRCYTSNH